ncbi:MAG: hypothetical protein QXV17_05185 [Candidatus Micrarchaeaceae archaeon]
MTLADFFISPRNERKVVIIDVTDKYFIRDSFESEPRKRRAHEETCPDCPCNHLELLHSSDAQNVWGRYQQQENIPDLTKDLLLSRCTSILTDRRVLDLSRFTGLTTIEFKIIAELRKS